MFRISLHLHLLVLQTPCLLLMASSMHSEFCNTSFTLLHIYTFFTHCISRHRRCSPIPSHSRSSGKTSGTSSACSSCTCSPNAAMIHRICCAGSYESLGCSNMCVPAGIWNLRSLNQERGRTAGNNGWLSTIQLCCICSSDFPMKHSAR